MTIIMEKEKEKKKHIIYLQIWHFPPLRNFSEPVVTLTAKVIFMGILLNACPVLWLLKLWRPPNHQVPVVISIMLGPRPIHKILQPIVHEHALYIYALFNLTMNRKPLHVQILITHYLITFWLVSGIRS